MSFSGKWNIVIKTPMGDQTGVLTLNEEGGALSGQMSGSSGESAVENGRVEDGKASWSVSVTSPMPVTLEFTGALEGADLNGTVKLGAFGESTFAGTPA